MKNTANAYSDLDGKVVLITGAATGIGASTVRLFSKIGASVFFCDLNSKAGEELVHDLPGVVFECVDMRDPLSVKKWVLKCGNVHNRIDVLVNNVADDSRCKFEQTDVSQIKTQFELNYFSAVYSIHAAVPFMKDRSSSIINYGSVTYTLGEKNLSGYVPAKAALLGLTRTLARELGPLQIRVNALSPGWVMTEKQVNERITPELQEKLKEWQSDPRLIQPDEISQIVLFLASEASAAITGQNLLADRGWTHI